MLAAMSWETVDSLPDLHPNGSPYQSLAEPVVAKRVGLRPLERLRLFWRSTPELPSKRAAESVTLTPSHLYVQRVDGSRQRVRVEALKGRRVEGPLVIYGVVEGEDLALVMRSGCPVITELDARLRNTAASELPPVVTWRHRGVGLFVASLFGSVGTFLLTEYTLEAMWDRIHRGLYTAEVVLGVAAGAAAMLAALLVLLLVPARIHIDTLGVRRVRGIVPWLPYLYPPETFRAVRVDVERMKTKGGGRLDLGYVVRLRRRGEAASEGDLDLRWFSYSEAVEKQETLRQADEFAQNVARLLELPVDRGS